MAYSFDERTASMKKIVKSNADWRASACGAQNRVVHGARVHRYLNANLAQQKFPAPPAEEATLEGPTDPKQSSRPRRCPQDRSGHVPKGHQPIAGGAHKHEGVICSHAHQRSTKNKKIQPTTSLDNPCSLCRQNATSEAKRNRERLPFHFKLRCHQPDGYLGRAKERQPHTTGCFSCERGSVSYTHLTLPTILLV